MLVFIFKSCDKVEPTWGPALSVEAPRPPYFPPMDIPDDNPLTKQGIKLGRFLFYEKMLSGDNTQACADCHLAEAAFSDPEQFSTGIDGLQGNRQSMAIINLGWNPNFFWDGRSATLEEQVLDPVENPIEMHENWTNAMGELLETQLYRRLFMQAYNTDDVDSTHAAKAMASFLRTLVSGNSKYDQAAIGRYVMTPEEADGRDIFTTERGDCFHCHGGILFTDHELRNNGLDPSHEADSGYYLTSGDTEDIGKFKVPTLRNIEFSAPYMHDGRFQTLDEVIDFYSEGLVYSETVDPLMKHVDDGGINMTPEEKANLKAFLLLLSDEEFINNPDFKKPY